MTRGRKRIAGQAAVQQDEPRMKSNAELAEKAMGIVFKNIGTKGVTAAEFIRLLEFQEEIGEDRPKEIKATWVEPAETQSFEK
jgi:bifunctional ADP-heptose synthase (sugar kinase/adenylyltransferase)